MQLDFNMLKCLMVGVFLFTLQIPLSAQFSADKVYTIESNNNSGKYMTDNLNGGISTGAVSDNSYWTFVSTGNEDCYYVKNVATQSYMQQTSSKEKPVATGSNGVEIYIKNDTDKGTNVYGLASTDRNPHDFSSNTYGANYHSGDGHVQGFNAQLGSGKNPNSFWKIVEADYNGYRVSLGVVIAAAEAYDATLTTPTLASSLSTALSEAKAIVSTNIDDLKATIAALNTALSNAKAVNASALRATITLAAAEGVDVTDANSALSSATTQGAVNTALDNLRIVRKRFHAETHADVFTGATPTAGDFYLYNVGERKFFCGGNGWGAHASLGFPGIKVTLEAAGDGVYKINTHLYNGMDNGNKKVYLNYEDYCDTWTSDTWTFISAGDGKYNIARYSNADNILGYNGGTYNNVVSLCHTRSQASNQWKLVTQAERDALMSDASEANPVDVSYLIKMPNFSQREFEETGGWDSGDNKAWSHVNGQIWERGSNHSDFVFECWNALTLNLSQVVTGLVPNGKYQLTFTGYYRDGNRANHVEILNGGGTPAQLAKLYLNDVEAATLPRIDSEKNEVPGIGYVTAIGQIPDGCDQAPEYFQLGLYKVESPVVTADGDGKLKISVVKSSRSNEKNGDWVVVDNFRLLYLGETDPEENYMPLPVKTGFDVDVVAEATPAADHTVGDAGLDQTGSVLYTQSLKEDGGLPDNGEITSLNGRKYFIDYTKLNALKITDNNNHTLTLSDQANARAIFVMGISSNGGSTVDVVVNYTDHTSSEAVTLVMLDWSDGSGDNLALNTLKRMSSRVNDASFQDNLFYPYEVGLYTDPSKEIESVTLTRTSGTGASNILAVSMYGKIVKDVTLNEGYATFSAAQPYRIDSEGVNAYKVTENSATEVNLVALTDGIPANTGVVLYGDGKSTVQLTAVSSSTSDVSGNLMKPNVSDYVLPSSVVIDDVTYNNYTLGKHSGEVKFLRSSGSGTLAAGKAYLQLEATAAARVSILFFDEEGEQITSISEKRIMKSEESANAPVYNLAGQRMDSSLTKKGLYVVNGKKLVVR